MTQRTAAHIGIWMMILAGILFGLLVLVVPYLASILNQMQTSLPFSAQLIFSFSNYIIQNGIFIAWLYSTLFISIIVWYNVAKVRKDNVTHFH